MGEKICCRCKIAKPRSAYNKASGSPTACNTITKVQAATAAARRAANPDKEGPTHEIRRRKPGQGQAGASSGPRKNPDKVRAMAVFRASREKERQRCKWRDGDGTRHLSNAAKASRNHRPLQGLR